ncbi:MAG: TetR/AcrR family transcriptional regulator [Anaerolineae bacterium]|nr:TetR/AcrR family transcriptional regulator [Anaerolineae bacterium]
MANQQRSEATRARILAAAAEAFAERGYDATGVAEICERAGVSKGAFYYHYQTKQALFLTLIDVWLQELNRALEQTDSDNSTVPDRVLAMSGKFQDILTSRTPQLALIMEFWTQASRDEGMRQAVLSHYRAFQQFFVDLIELGVAEGTLSPIDPAAGGQVFLSLTSGLFFQGLLDPTGADWGKVAERSTRIVLDSMRRRE